MNSTQQQTPRTIAQVTMVNPAEGMIGRGLTYGINRNGKHVIINVNPLRGCAGENDIYRFETVKDARVCWKRIMSELKARGCVPQVA